MYFWESALSDRMLEGSWGSKYNNVWERKIAENTSVFVSCELNHQYLNNTYLPRAYVEYLSTDFLFVRCFIAGPTFVFASRIGTMYCTSWQAVNYQGYSNRPLFHFKLLVFAPLLFTFAKFFHQIKNNRALHTTYRVANTCNFNHSTWPNINELLVTFNILNEITFAWK